MKLTMEIFKAIEPGDIIASGMALNSPEELYMVDSNKGRVLKWVAKKGYGGDWAIYCYWANSSWDYVLRSGDKVHTIEHIQRLVPCDDDVLKKYRH